MLVCHCGYLMCPSCWHESGGCDYEKGILREYDRHGVHGIDWQETVLINRSHQRSPPDWPLPVMETDSAVGEAAENADPVADSAGDLSAGETAVDIDHLSVTSEPQT